jgi:quinohemoprotein ethanol dehydrogenase
MAPDLRASTIALNLSTFIAVVRNGVKQNTGMPSFPEMSDEELTALMHYIRKAANESKPENKARVGL